MSEKELNPLIKMIIANNYTGEIPAGAKDLVNLFSGILGAAGAANIGATLARNTVGGIAERTPGDLFTPAINSGLSLATEPLKVAIQQANAKDGGIVKT